MSIPELLEGKLSVAGNVLFDGVSDALVAERDPTGTGLFLRARLPERTARTKLGLGKASGLGRFMACHRYEPFWMRPKAGSEVGDVPVETQVLLLELESGEVALLVPLVHTPFRASLFGSDGALSLSLETGDPHTLGDSALALFVAAGDDVFDLVSRAARAVAERGAVGRLRVNKPLPDFADWFGWCTWDAFYQEVSHDKVRQGLESFRAGGVRPRLLILDDGWQSEHRMPTGERRLTSFDANRKFDGTLAPTVRMAKEEFGVRTFLVWHAVHGYWGGVDQRALPGYGVRDTQRSYSPGILSHAPNFNEEWWGPIVGLILPEDIARFYDDYHRLLAAQGVDGVKVDNQASIEGLGFGLGGRVALMHAYRKALESSALAHFSGRLINCMSCSNEMLYAAADSTLVRTSTDFWPNLAESHGLHLYTNAQVGVWFGEWVHPDWDMFQSGHPRGAYHAAGRAVSGSPVYVSDKPGQHDFEVLRKLTLSDGSVLRASHVGRPTRDCLFHDPTREDVLLKVFNLNLEAGVIGVFNARCREPAGEIAGKVSPSDVYGLGGREFAVYSHYGKRLERVARDAALPVTLADLSAEVFTIVPLDRGVAPIGLADKFNSAGAITEKGWQGGTYTVRVRDGGRFLAFSERKPTRVSVDDAERPFSYEAGALELALEKEGAQSVSLAFD